jgi:putative resolvase
MSQQYLGSKAACKILGIHFMTLRNWEIKGKIEAIRTPGRKRLFNVQKFIEDNKNSFEEKSEKKKRYICYCRVSTTNQKDDLERQIEYMKSKYPEHEIIKEMGSGINFKRKKLLSIIKSAIKGEIAEIVVAHKDRLARFGFELIEFIIKEYSDGEIIVLNKKKMSPEEEITNDLVSIINVFSARINGLRKYKNKVKKIGEKIGGKRKVEIK